LRKGSEKRGNLQLGDVKHVLSLISIFVNAGITWYLSFSRSWCKRPGLHGGLLKGCSALPDFYRFPGGFFFKKPVCNLWCSRIKRFA